MRVQGAHTQPTSISRGATLCNKFFVHFICFSVVPSPLLLFYSSICWLHKTTTTTQKKKQYNTNVMFRPLAL